MPACPGGCDLPHLEEAKGSGHTSPGRKAVARPLPPCGPLCTPSPAELQLTLLSTALVWVASQTPLPFPTSSPQVSPVFSFSSHKNVSAGPGLLSHPIVNKAVLSLPTGQAQACPTGQSSPPAGAHIHLFTFGSQPRLEPELHLTPAQSPLPSRRSPWRCPGMGVGIQLSPGEHLGFSLGTSR